MSKFSKNFQKVTQVKHWTENLFSFRITRPKSFKFRSGEFVMIGLLDSDDKPILRAYSICSPSWSDELEFYSIIVKEGYISNRIHVEDLSSFTLQYIKNNYTEKILNISDQKKVSTHDAIKFVCNELNLVEPNVVRYDPKKVSKMLKSFYEVNRTVKSNIINHKISYNFKYPNYKLALLGLTKSLLDSV